MIGLLIVFAAFVAGIGVGLAYHDEIAAALADAGFPSNPTTTKEIDSDENP